MKRLLILAILLAAAGAAGAQYTAKKVVFTQMGPYTQAELEAAAGLKTGQSFSAADLSAAAQRLSDTSCFDSVDAALDGPFKTITVTFKVVPSPVTGMLRAGFENFVWLTPDEVTSAVHAKVPLFHGYVPEAGGEMDAVGAALQEALAARGVNALVEHATHERATGHPERVIEYVVKQRVVVGSVDLTGIAPAMQPAMTKQIAAVTGYRYNEGLAGQNTAETLLMPYLDAGYVEAKLTGLTRTPTASGEKTVVALKASIDPGEVYTVSSIAPDASVKLPAGATMKLAAGQVASRRALLETLAPIEEGYRNRGYMDAAADAVPTLDGARKQVAYVITVVPGEVYKVRSVTPIGLSAPAQADYDRGWMMKPGDVYDPSYVATFLKKNTALRALAGYSAGFKAVSDPETHLVDVTIAFQRGPGAR